MKTDPTGAQVHEPFNPYCTWLGFEPGREPGTHYQLLGLATFEADPEVIARAADAATSRVRGVRPGEHLAQWQALLDHLKAVKSCLLNPAVKAQYDALLQSTAEPAGGVDPSGPETAAPAMDAAASPPSSPGAVDSTVIDAPGRMPQTAVLTRERARAASPRGGSAGRFLAQTLFRAFWLACLIVVVGFGMHVVRLKLATPTEAPAVEGTEPAASQPQEPVAEASQEPDASPQPADPATPVAAASVTPPPAPPQPSQPVESAAPAPPKADNPRNDGPQPAAVQQPVGDPAPPDTRMAAAPPVDPARQATLTRELAAARTAMSERDLDAAASHLGAAAAVVQTPDQRSEVKRLRTVIDHLDEFWTAVGEAVAGLHSGQELTIQNMVILVVEASPDRVVLRAQGRNYTYPIRQIPYSVALHLAETWLADVPSSKVFLGTFLTVDPKGDRARARQLLTEAAGAGLDVEDVLAELRIAPPSTASKSGSTGATTAAAGRPGEKLPVPTDEAALKKAADDIHEIFESEYSAATTPAGKSSLASKLLEQAAALDNEPVGRFVMLSEARDLAAEAGDPAVAGKAVEQLGQSYDVDVLAMGVSALTKAAQNVRGLDGQREIAQAALSATADAVKQGRLKEAKELADLAEAAAVKAKNVSLVRAARTASAQVDAAMKQAK